MTTIAYSPVNIQTSTQSVPSIPDWFGEVTLIVSHLHHQGVFADLAEQVRFARRRFGRYEVIDFLAVLDQSAVESLRTLFLKDLLARPLEKEEQPGGMFDRQGTHYLVFDVDGTREAARQRALPKTADRPAPHLASSINAL